MKTDFYVVGIDSKQKREDRLLKVGEHHYCLIFGKFENKEMTYEYRKSYNVKPTETQLKSDIDALVNRITDKSILNDFVWQDKPVYLSVENQMNFKTAYDLAIQTEGDTLPLTFKLGEDADEKPVYHTFKTLDELKDFYQSAVMFVMSSISKGWSEKDSFDAAKILQCDE